MDRDLFLDYVNVEGNRIGINIEFSLMALMRICRSTALITPQHPAAKPGTAPREQSPIPLSIFDSIDPTATSKQ
jgi:hypothetical protein